MIEHDIIEPSPLLFNSNPLLVSKEDNSKRFVVDSRLVNRNTVQDTYPLPTVEELVDEAFGFTLFSQLLSSNVSEVNGQDCRAVQRKGCNQPRCVC